MNTLSEALEGLPGITIEGAVQSEEVWQILLHVTSTPEGWRSLEFLAWAVRDMKRGGLAIMLEATSPAPHWNEPGNSLRFLLHGAERVTEDSSAGRVAFHLNEWRKYYVPAEF